MMIFLVLFLVSLSLGCLSKDDEQGKLDIGVVYRLNLESTMSDKQQNVNTKECPTIVSRTEWNARSPKCNETMKTPVPFVIIHHTHMDRCHDYDHCCAEVRKIQDFHMDVRGWCDIGYTFLVGEDGRVYEGRGWDTIGAHCPWYNHQSIGISIMGDFTTVIPDKIATDTVQALIKCAVERGKLSPDFILYGHRQGRNGTTCPGDALFKEIQSWPHWKPGDHFPPK
ncbi:peptidoglycan recognition protein 1-like [Amphiura filiformis]|uniref:peptidoglycan recognition protein 1-like n=1 Tax=Amphiura filiformis TaxID=82378 RepID=UPI003B22252B